MAARRGAAAVLVSPRVRLILLFGFSSGLPLLLTDSTLQARLAEQGASLGAIGLFTLVGLPYTLKFLWAPLLDRYAWPFLGRRRGWAVVTQGVLAGLIALMAVPAVFANPAVLGVVALSVAFASATQDIVVDAYRVDALPPEARGAGAAAIVLGYRVAMLTAGGLALVVADVAGWVAAYGLMAACMLVGLVASVLAREPASSPPESLSVALSGPVRALLSRQGAVGLLLLVVLYKLGDTAANALTTAFLLRGVGFPLAVVGAFNAGWGLALSIGGAVTGGLVLARWPLVRALFVFGVLQALTNLLFLWLAMAGPSYPLLALVIGTEQFVGGLGTAAFVALLTALCARRFSATQYALLSALAAQGRVLAGPPGGMLAEAAGWPAFFVATALAALPGLWLVVRQRDAIAALDREADDDPPRVGEPHP